MYHPLRLGSKCDGGDDRRLAQILPTAAARRCARAKLASCKITGLRPPSAYGSIVTVSPTGVSHGQGSAFLARRWQGAVCSLDAASRASIAPLLPISTLAVRACTGTHLRRRSTTLGRHRHPANTPRLRPPSRPAQAPGANKSASAKALELWEGRPLRCCPAPRRTGPHKGPYKVRSAEDTTAVRGYRTRIQRSSLPPPGAAPKPCWPTVPSLPLDTSRAAGRLPSSMAAPWRPSAPNCAVHFGKEEQGNWKPRTQDGERGTFAVGRPPVLPVRPWPRMAGRPQQEAVLGHTTSTHYHR